MVLCSVGTFSVYINSRYSAMMLCCMLVEFIVFTAKLGTVHWYCVVCDV